MFYGQNTEQWIEEALMESMFIIHSKKKSKIFRFLADISILIDTMPRKECLLTIYPSG